MKRISFRLSIALITFSLGVGAAWSYLHIVQSSLTVPESTPTKEADLSPSLLSSPASPSEAVTITLTRSYRNDYGLGLINAEFEVINGGSEPLYYQGYGKDDNEYWSVRRGSRSKRFAPSCGTGLAERRLLPGESAKFKVVVGSEGGNVQVGFDFFIGDVRLRQTIWSESVYIPES